MTDLPGRIWVAEVAGQVVFRDSKQQEVLRQLAVYLKGKATPQSGVSVYSEIAGRREELRVEHIGGGSFEVSPLQ